MNLLINNLRRSISYTIKSPLDLALFRSVQSVEIVKTSLRSRFRDQIIAQHISSKLKVYRQELFNLEALNRKANSLKSQMKTVMTKNKSSQSIQLIKSQISKAKQSQKQKEIGIRQLISEIQMNLLKVGNIIHSDVTLSKDQNLNKVLNTYNPLQEVSNKKSQKYQEINEKFKISDLKRGQKVSGHRGYFLKHDGLKLALALTHYGIQFLQSQGYELFQTPAIIVENILKQNCQLKSIQQDMYKLVGQQSVLIATSEQSLAGYYKGQVLQARQLPIRMGGYSTCFRKQAGAHGKDIHGLFRVHQFQKIQQFLICQPSQSDSLMKKMLQVSQKFYQSLKIPYRVVDIVSGQLNDAAIRKFDLEGWYPSQNKYRQLVSISNCTDYQSRMSDIRYRNGSSTEYVHMLNGTLTAVERTLTCIMENHYDSDQNVLKIPQKLQKYFSHDKIIKPIVE